MNAESWLLAWPGWLLQSIESIDPQQHGFAQEVLAEAMLLLCVVCWEGNARAALLYNLTPAAHWDWGAFVGFGPRTRSNCNRKGKGKRQKRRARLPLSRRRTTLARLFTSLSP